VHIIQNACLIQYIPWKYYILLHQPTVHQESIIYLYMRCTAMMTTQQCDQNFTLTNVPQKKHFHFVIFLVASHWFEREGDWVSTWWISVHCSNGTQNCVVCKYLCV